MGKLYRRNRIYYADFEDERGIRRRVSLKTSDRKVAKERLRKIELSETDRATHSTERLSASLDYLTNVAMPTAGRADGTIRSYASKARHLVRIFGIDAELGNVTRDAVQVYIKTRIDEGASSSTIHKELVTLRQSLNEAKSRGIYSGDPKSVIPKFSAKYQPRDRHLSPEELSRLLADLLPSRKLWVMIAAFAGLRHSEIEGLQWEDVDFGRGWIRVRGTKTKGSFRRVPILAQLRPWLEAFDRGEGHVVEPWSNARRDLHVHCRRAGIAPISPNDLRRTFTSWMKQSGIDSLTVAQMLGHSSTRMVEMVYGRLTDATFQAASKICAVFVTENCAELANPGDIPDLIAGPEKTKAVSNTGFETAFAVPGDRIELPTRGFSVPELTIASAGKTKGKKNTNE